MGNLPPPVRRLVPTGFTLLQSIVVITASILAILGAMWAPYGMRHPEPVESAMEFL